VTTRLGRRRRLRETVSETSGHFPRSPSVRLLFARTLRLFPADASCRHGPAYPTSRRRNDKPWSHQTRGQTTFRARRTTPLPSRVEAPSTSESPTTTRKCWSEPPHPPWFGHQTACFRHILHALRCALDPLTEGFKPPMCAPCAAPRLLSIQRSTSTLRASKKLRPGRLASCLRRMTYTAARCEAFPLLRAVMSISRLTLCEG
jgi:hypothetical protein